jgi:hypothetical protein
MDNSQHFGIIDSQLVDAIVRWCFYATILKTSQRDAFRVSTKQQDQSGLGLDARRSAAEAYVKEHGGEIIGEHQEVETGKDSKRPEIMKAIMHANRSWATLVIATLDRLARNVWFTSTLMESGIDFVACDSPQASRLTIHILPSHKIFMGKGCRCSQSPII